MLMLLGGCYPRLLRHKKQIIRIKNWKPNYLSQYQSDTVQFIVQGDNKASALCNSLNVNSFGSISNTNFTHQLPSVTMIWTCTFHVNKTNRCTEFQCTIIIPIKLEFSASVGFIHMESVTMHGPTIVNDMYLVCV